MGFPSWPSRTPLTQGLSPVLSATQHVLLAEVLEMGALSGAFKLVSGPSL